MPNVSTIMHKHIVGVAETTSISYAAKLINVNKVPSLPVLRDGRIVGILSEEAVDKFFKKHGNNEQDIKVGSIMDETFYFVEMNDDIADAARVMVSRKITRLPVVNNKKEMLCVGMITSTDIAANIK
ncbi:MAG: CBS domain-containing protein [Candidatus Micrarchaeia archaeon]